MNEIKNLKPFPRFCCSIGYIPTSYKVSMTYEEQLLWLCDFLENTVIPTVNQNGEAVEELQNLFIELKNYVDNYFENLDIQTEINNKLDEMAESGQLTEIIEPFIENKLLRVYLTVNDMKNDNLIEGNKCKTLGYYEVNDGGNAFYNIVENQPSSGFYETLSNGKYAVLIIENDTLNIKQIGAKNDDLTDNTQYFNIAYNLNCSTIFIPSGTYQTGKLTFTNKIINGENNTYLKANQEISDNWITIGNRCIINNIIFNGNNLADTVFINTSNSSADKVQIKNCIFALMTKSGLTSNGIDVIIKNCIFRGNNQHGLRIRQVGNIISSCYSYSNGLAGFFTSTGTCIFNSCKCYKNKTWGFIIQGTTANYVTVESCESQQNGLGSIYLANDTNNCIINALNSLGENDLSTINSITERSAVLFIGGKNHKINAVVTPFHVYAPNNWYGYPRSLLQLSDTLNCDINITYNIIENELDILKNNFPALTYNEFSYINNMGQSNSIIINNNECANKLSIFNSDNLYQDRGDFIGDKNIENSIFIAKPNFVNGLNLNTNFSCGVYETSLDDNFNIKGYQAGIVFPLNYQDYFKACLRIDIVGIVNNAEVMKTGVNSDLITKNNDINDYVSYIMDAVQYITSLNGYVSGSLKMRARIMCTKTSQITLNEPLLLACKNCCLKYDIQ